MRTIDFTSFWVLNLTKISKNLIQLFLGRKVKKLYRLHCSLRRLRNGYVIFEKFFPSGTLCLQVTTVEQKYKKYVHYLYPYLWTGQEWRSKSRRRCRLCETVYRSCKSTISLLAPRYFARLAPDPGRATFVRDCPVSAVNVSEVRSTLWSAYFDRPLI